MDLLTASTVMVGIVTAGGIALKIFGRNSSKNTISPEECESNRDQIQKDLDRGEKKFDKLFKAVESQGETLVRIDERTLIWAKKNGYENG